MLLESVTRLTASDPPFRVAIFGEGTLGPTVTDAVAPSSTARMVVSPPMADLRARLDSFDAILMPSRFEGLSLLAVEAPLCRDPPPRNERSRPRRGAARLVPRALPSR